MDLARPLMLWSAGREGDGEAPVEERRGSRSATAPPVKATSAAFPPSLPDGQGRL